MKRTRVASFLCLLCMFGDVAAKAQNVLTITVTNVATNITVDQDSYFVQIRENSATPTAAFDLTFAGSAVVHHFAAGTIYTFAATKRGGGPSPGGGPFKSGTVIGTIVATTAGPFTFTGDEFYGDPSLVAKNNNGSGGSATPGGTSGQMQWNSSGVFAGFGSYNSSTLLATFPGGVATTTSGGYGGFISSPEGTVGNGTLGANAAAATDVCYADTTTHAYLCSFNNSAFLPLVTSPVALSELATQAANTIDMNASGSSAAPTAVVMPACAASGHADVYDPSAHTWTCNSIGGGAGVVLVPATTAANTIAPTANSVVGLTVLGTTGTAGDSLDVCANSAGACGAKQFWVDSGGSSSQGGFYGHNGLTSYTFLQLGFAGASTLTFNNAGDHIVNGSTNANTDTEGILAVSASTTAARTFTTTWTNAPVCTLTPASDPTATGVYWVTTSTTTLTVTVKASGTISFNYLCFGHGQ